MARGASTQTKIKSLDDTASNSDGPTHSTRGSAQRASKAQDAILRRQKKAEKTIQYDDLSASETSTSSDDPDDADEFKADSDDLKNASGLEDDDDTDDVASEDIDDEELSIKDDSSDNEKEGVIDMAVDSKKKKKTPIKRKKGDSAKKSNGGSSSKKQKTSSNDKAQISDYEDENDSDEDEEEEKDLGDGRKVVRTKLVKAPTSTVEAGIIDPNTMKFLRDMIANNDREWFAKNDARYRHALKNWQDFVGAVQTEFQRGDWSIPELPAKELIHRIYRDVRFSQDKTPYKRNFSASFSRTGRKGPFAGYYLQIAPGNSLLAGGRWDPPKNDLATIRSNILRSSKPFRRVISDANFVKHFGPAKPDGKGKGKRCNVFGADDALKIAPKMNGVDKNHKDIDLLKLRTIGVVYNFDDQTVLSETFMTKIGDVVAAMSPLVLLVNDMLHPQSDNEENADENESDDEQAQDDEGSADENGEGASIEEA
ncbi:hypothetical protein EMMF5_002561 [Cystobasidiomycetes sp. EMM_F5]